jgi:glutathione S-transferase
MYETDPTTGHTLELAEMSAIELYLGDKYGWMGDNLWERAQIQMYHSST